MLYFSKFLVYPTLQKELQKYGIRPISRQKALALLQHVYEQTHPLVTDSEADSSFLETPQHKTPSKHACKYKEWYLYLFHETNIQSVI